MPAFRSDEPFLMDLTGKTIVVTGAASGIGAATAAEVQRQGAEVIAVDRNPVEVVATVYQADLGDRASIAELVATLPDGVDGIANIAGVPPTAPPADVLRVNLAGLQLFTESMISKLADGASIVNLVSSAARGWQEAIDQIREFESVGWDNISDFLERHPMESDGRSYFFAKEALLVWTMENRWSWLDRGIRMNAVSPGPVDTPILKDFLATLGPKAQESMAAMDRLGRPGDVAPVVAFLLSDGAAWFRGANLTPDGGLSSYFTMQAHGLS